MTRIGNHEFDRERYDSEGDVLYLSRGPEQSAASTFATPEGHAVRLDEAGNLIGLTIVNAKRLLDRDGKLVVTTPERIESSRADLEPALTGSTGSRQPAKLPEPHSSPMDTPPRPGGRPRLREPRSRGDNACLVAQIGTTNGTTDDDRTHSACRLRFAAANPG